MTTLLLKRGSFSALTLEGFIEREATLWNALNKSTEEPLAKLKTELLDAAASNGLLTLFGRHKLNRAVNAALKKFTDSLLEIAPAVAADAQESIAREAVAESQNQWFSKPKVGKADAQEILEREFLLRNNALFMGRFLNETLPEKVKYAIAEAYNAALGKPFDEKLEIVQSQLAERFGKVAEAPSNYWKVFSVNALNNARTYAQLRTFERQSGVVGYRIRAVMDGKTSNICQALNNRVFPVRQALDRFEQMFQAESLDDLRAISPMVQGSSDKGFHYDLSGGAGKQALDVDNYQGLLSEGISFPPFHFNCRTSLEPVFDLILGPSDYVSDITQELYEDAKMKIDTMLNIFSDGIDLKDKEKKRERKKLITPFFDSLPNLAINGFDQVIAGLKGSLEKLADSGADEKFKKEFGAVKGRLKELQLAYYLESHGWKVVGFNIPIPKPSSAKSNAPSDMDVVAIKNGVLGLFESKTGKNADIKKQLTRGSVIDYGTFLQGIEINAILPKEKQFYPHLFAVYLPDIDVIEGSRTFKHFIESSEKFFDFTVYFKDI